MKIDLTQDISLLLKRDTPLIVLESPQEKVALELLTRLAISSGEALFRWSVTEGLETLGFSPRIAQSNGLQKPEEALKDIKDRQQGGTFVLCDFHPYWEGEPTIVRLLKDIILDFDLNPKRIILLSHAIALPAELQSYATQASLSLPLDEEIMAIVRREAKLFVARGGRVKTKDGKTVKAQQIKTDVRALQQLVSSLRGLTERDVARLAHHAIFDDGAITASDIPEVNSAKFALLNQQGLLSYEYDTEDFARVGGLENFKGWLTQRRKAFLDLGSIDEPSSLAEQLQDAPKGVLLLGVQGGGKSLAARAVAGLWGLPLLRLDMGSLYNKFIGETEKNLRNALEQAEKMSPCVLWLDELEKALAQGNGDDALNQRLLGYLLTWMAERKAPVFMVATSNNIRKLPAELVRKGRFDEIFFVDLPEAKVREDIFAIHLTKRDMNPSDYNLQRLSEATEGFSGAEIEQVIVSTRYACNTTSMNEDDIVRAIYQTSPLSVVMAEQLAELRHWASDRAVLA
mgnify:CR=1 FL=1